MDRKIILFLVVALSLGACSTDDYVQSSIDSFIDSQTSFQLLDTFSVTVENLMLDSVETANTGTLLAGRYVDSELGTVTASSYFLLSLPSSTDVDDDEVYDSLVISLRYDDYWYGDTLDWQTIQVSEVIEEIEETDDDSYFNNTEFEVSDESWGDTLLIPKMYKDEAVTFRLSDELGQEIFTKMLDNDDDFSSDDDFQDYIQGIYLSGTDDNTAILSFIADSVTITLHTHISDDEKEEITYDFNIDTSEDYFNHIESDRSGTAVSSLVQAAQEDAYSSTLCDDKGFVEGGVGIVTRLNFPTLSRMVELDDESLMYKAELVLRPYPGSEDELPLPETLMLYYTDKYNDLSSSVTDDDGDVVYSTLNYDYLTDDYYYTLDISYLLYQELSDGFVDDDLGIILSIPSSDMETSLDRLILDARTEEDYRPVLNVYYMFFE